MLIILSKRTQRRLVNLLEYLENEWSVKTKHDFVKKLDKSLHQIQKHPESCPKSDKIKGLYKCIVTHQITIFYRIKADEIEIVTLFDTRQDPGKLRKEN